MLQNQHKNNNAAEWYSSFGFTLPAYHARSSVGSRRLLIRLIRNRIITGRSHHHNLVAGCFVRRLLLTHGYRLVAFHMVRAVKRRARARAKVVTGVLPSLRGCRAKRRAITRKTARETV